MVFVVDTSVFLSDPKTLERLKDKNIVIPLVVLTELEDKRNHPDLGFSAREILRSLESLRKKNELINPSTNEFGGSVRVELNNIHSSDIPEAFQAPLNDNKILAVAYNLSNKEDVTLLTKDLPLRLKASVLGIKSDDYSQDDFNESWIGIEEVNVDHFTIDEIYEEGSVRSAESFPENTGIILKSGNQSALAKYRNGNLKLIKDKNIFDVRGRSAEQRIAIDFLTDPSIEIVSIGGNAGTGKSLIALAAGLESVIEKRQHKKVVIFRPLYAVGGQDLGYLPGTAEE